MVSFYVDAVPVGTVAVNGPPAAAPRDLVLGNDLQQLGDFDGRLDDLRIYDGPLPPGAISQLVSRMAPRLDGGHDHPLPVAGRWLM